MRFIDEVKIFVSSGNGGHGCASFRREKYIPFGGAMTGVTEEKAATFTSKQLKT